MVDSAFSDMVLIVSSVELEMVLEVLEEEPGAIGVVMVEDAGTRGPLKCELRPEEPLRPPRSRDPFCVGIRVVSRGGRGVE